MSQCLFVKSHYPDSSLSLHSEEEESRMHKEQNWKGGPFPFTALPPYHHFNCTVLLLTSPPCHMPAPPPAAPVAAPAPVNI